MYKNFVILVKYYKLRIALKRLGSSLTISDFYLVHKDFTALYLEIIGAIDPYHSLFNKTTSRLARGESMPLTLDAREIHHLKKKRFENKNINGTFFTNFILNKIYDDLANLWHSINFKNHFSTASSNNLYPIDIYYYFSEPIKILNSYIPISDEFQCKYFKFEPNFFEWINQTHKRLLDVLNVSNKDACEVIFVLFYDIKPNIDDHENISQLMLDIYDNFNKEGGISKEYLYYKYNLVSYILTFKSVLDCPFLIKEEEDKIKNVILNLLKLEKKGVELKSINGPLYCSISICSKSPMVIVNNTIKLRDFGSTL